MNRLPLLILTASIAVAIPHAIRAEDGKPAAKGEKRGPGGPGGRMNPEERLKMMTEKLSLTQEQQDKVKAIMEKSGPQMREIMAKGRDNVSEEDKTKIREMMKSQAEEIGAVLTSEQKEKWKEAREAGGPGGPGGERRGKPGKGKAN